VIQKSGQATTAHMNFTDGQQGETVYWEILGIEAAKDKGSGPTLKAIMVKGETQRWRGEKSEKMERDR